MLIYRLLTEKEMSPEIIKLIDRLTGSILASLLLFTGKK